jgi:hypothetical protein
VVVLGGGGVMSGFCWWRGVAEIRFKEAGPQNRVSSRVVNVLHAPKKAACLELISIRFAIFSLHDSDFTTSSYLVDCLLRLERWWRLAPTFRVIHAFEMVPILGLNFCPCTASNLDFHATPEAPHPSGRKYVGSY